MPNPTPLNPDALKKAYDAARSHEPSYRARLITVEELAERITRAYLAVAQPAAQKLTDAEWQAFQAIPDQGYSHRAWVDARIAERLVRCPR